MSEISIRRLKISDADKIAEYLKPKEMRRWLDEIPWPYTKRDALKFIRKKIYQRKKKKSFCFGILYNGKLVGVIEIFNVDKKNKNAEIGYWIGMKYQGRGIGSEAVKLILEFAFKNLKLHKVYARASKGNEPSIHVLEKNGFKIEGKRREHRKLHGKWYGVLEFGILRKEFK